MSKKNPALVRLKLDWTQDGIDANGDATFNLIFGDYEVFVRRQITPEGISGNWRTLWNNREASAGLHDYACSDTAKEAAEERIRFLVEARVAAARVAFDLYTAPIPDRQEYPPDADDKKFLEGVVGVVEADSFSQSMLWSENQDRLNGHVAPQRAGIPGREWVSNSSGVGVTVGAILGDPVFISIYTAVIDGKKVAFVDPTSKVIDHDMVRRWLKRALPKSAFRDDGRINLEDANNFYNVFR